MLNIEDTSNNNNNKNTKKFKGNEFAIPIYTPRSAYNFIRQNGSLNVIQMSYY